MSVMPMWRYHRTMAMDDAGCVTKAIAAGVSPAAALFRSLSDETRLRILARLAAGEARVVDLTGELGLAQSTVSKHLVCLRGCGLVDYRAEGRQSFYALTCPELLPSSSDEDSLRRIQVFLTARQQKFGRRAHLAVTWRRPAEDG